MHSTSEPFYVLSDPVIGRTHAEADVTIVRETPYGPAPRCGLCGQFIGMLTWLPPYVVELEYLAEYHGDIAFCLGDILVSEKFARAMDADKITGLDVLGPVKVASVSPREMAKGMPKYFVARVDYSKAIFDDIRSKAEYEERWTCPDCRIGKCMLRYERVVLVDGTWSGEDVFIAIGLPGVILVSERFKEFCERHAFKNVHLIPASEYSVDWYPGWNPGEEEG